ncbi:MAG TPA: diaminopimelate epimerase [Actinobacteria bacterium]|nr:diaminopimelate epimerase [Actinomycetota bacterium]
MNSINFTKSHGLGNDFIIVEDLKNALDITAPMIRLICDRHFGVGADGLILVKNSTVADYKMDFRNADGSASLMCGNGIRVLAKYIFDNLSKTTLLRIETGAGIKDVELAVEDSTVLNIQVDMGKPGLASEDIPVITDKDRFISFPLEIEEFRAEATCVSMGNPHCVIFVNDVVTAKVGRLGPLIEALDIFPDKTNVEFVQVVADDHLRVRVWERGVGETLACGTGACAAVVAANISGVAARTARVGLPGGDLFVDWRADNHVSLVGSATEVFTGKTDLDYWRDQGEGIEHSKEN